MGKHPVREHLFSADYFLFLPAIMVCIAWFAIPVPEVGRAGLLIWSLPLFSAGAAHALQKGPETLWQRIHRRCPMQGVLILFYTAGAAMLFFFLLLLSAKAGLLGKPGGEVLFTALFAALWLLALYRLWPDYLIRVIHPWPGSTDSWIGHDTMGLGPGPWTSWKYTGRAGLPPRETVGVLLSLLIIGGSLVLFFSATIQAHGGTRFLFFLTMLTIVFPPAHLFLIQAGYRLLAANHVPLDHPVRKPNSVPRAPVTALRRPIVVDEHAIVDERVFDMLQGETIITGWLFERSKGRRWNGVVGYNATEGQLVFAIGPVDGGHWGHDAHCGSWEPYLSLLGGFPEWCGIPDDAKEMVVRFLKRREEAQAGSDK